MRTSLIEIAQIESYLNAECSAEESVLFEAKMLLNKEWNEKVLLQKKAHRLIEEYGDRQLKNELELIHQRLFRQAKYRSFKEKVFQFFS